MIRGAARIVEAMDTRRVRPATIGDLQKLEGIDVALDGLNVDMSFRGDRWAGLLHVERLRHDGFRFLLSYRRAHNPVLWQSRAGGGGRLLELHGPDWERHAPGAAATWAPTGGGLGA